MEKEKKVRRKNYGEKQGVELVVGYKSRYKEKEKEMVRDGGGGGWYSI